MSPADLQLSAALSQAKANTPWLSAALAGALGREIWVLVSGRVWPQLGTDYYPWYARSRVFACEKFGDWTAAISRVRDALAEFRETQS